MNIHGIISSYFGDNELDVGKSVTWTQLFCDTEFIQDSQSGLDTRLFVIDWAKTYPSASYGYRAGNSFLDSPESAALWRQSSFDKAYTRFKYSDDDWVLFVDATEGLSVDYSSPPPPTPPEFGVGDPFKTYVLDEIANSSPTADMLYINTWAFVRDSVPFNVFGVIDPELDVYLDGLDGDPPSGQYAGLSESFLRASNATKTVATYSYYAYAGMLPRLIKVSALRSPGFDWSLLDFFVEGPPAGHPNSESCEQYLSLISYAYARWAEPVNVDPETGAATSALTDIGYQMRQAISNVRPISGLGTSSWATPDSAVEYSPTPVLEPGVGTKLSEEGPEFSTDFSSSTLNFHRRAVPAAPDPWSGGLELLTPLYKTTFRSNPREGVFYKLKQLGPIPWDEVTGQPAINPAVWNYPSVSESWSGNNGPP